MIPTYGYGRGNGSGLIACYGYGRSFIEVVASRIVFLRRVILNSNVLMRLNKP